MASELGRVAHAAAIRSPSLLRISSPRVQFGFIATCQRRTPTPLPLRSLGASLPIQRQQSYSSSISPWTTPSREQRPSEIDTEIQKPKTALYYDSDSANDDPDPSYDGIMREIDLELDDLERRRTPDTTTLPPVPKPTMRLVPRLGRTVNVTHNVDVARSFKLLAIQVAQNRIRQEHQAQRYHERPGLKRKRLRSERWQRRFKRGFKETVTRVKELTKQGW